MAKVRRYDDDSIISIRTDRERIRKRPTTYIPDVGVDGVRHVHEEGFDNSLDELNAEDSPGTEVVFIYDVDKHEVTITDDGRGIPLKKIVDSCTVINTSGKFDNDDDTAYQDSGGTNGVGMKLMNFFSDYMKVTSMRDNKSLHVEFEDGAFKSQTEGKSKKHGTVITYRLSERFLSVHEFDYKEIQNMIKEKSYIFPKVKMTFIAIKNGNEIINKTYVGKTMADRMAKLKPDTEIIHVKGSRKTEVLGKDLSTLVEKTCRINLMFAFSDHATEVNDPLLSNITYGNTIRTTMGGMHLEGLKEGIIKFFKNEIPKRMNKKELEGLNITNNDITSGLVSVVWVGVNNPIYRGQYKDMINNPEVKIMVREAVYETLCDLKEPQIKKMCDFIKDISKGRLAAKASKKKKDVTNTFSKDKINKYVPLIKSLKTTTRELYIVEGDSALNAAVNARDKDTQAIYAMTGRPDNVIDMTVSQVEKLSTAFNEIMDILGLQLGKNFDIADCQFDAICIASDSDTDKNLSVPY